MLFRNTISTLLLLAIVVILFTFDLSLAMYFCLSRNGQSIYHLSICHVGVADIAGHCFRQNVHVIPWVWSRVYRTAGRSHRRETRFLALPPQDVV